MDNDDIPVLTEVYDDKPAAATNAQLSANDLAALKQQLKAEILAELKQEVRQEFLDKNAELLKSNEHTLNALATKLSAENTERISLDIASKVSGMQELAVSQAKAQIAESFTNAEANLNKLMGDQQTVLQKQLLQTQQSQIEEIKTKALAQIDADVAAKKADFVKNFDAEFPEVDKAMRDKFNQLLNAELPVFEESMMLKVKSKVIETLQSVKLVFPK